MQAMSAMPVAQSGDTAKSAAAQPVQPSGAFPSTSAWGAAAQQPVNASAAGVTAAVTEPEPKPKPKLKASARGVVKTNPL